MSVCIFCLGLPMATSTGCTYGLPHEEPLAKPKQEAKPDLARCVLCNVHPKNPIAATNGCAHQFPKDRVSK